MLEVDDVRPEGSQVAQDRPDHSELRHWLAQARFGEGLEPDVRPQPGDLCWPGRLRQQQADLGQRREAVRQLDAILFEPE
jgi:hypothetical protein